MLVIFGIMVTVPNERKDDPRSGLITKLEIERTECLQLQIVTRNCLKASVLSTRAKFRTMHNQQNTA